jgi:hypothetical protein
LLRLNIPRRDHSPVGNFLSEVSDNKIERAPGQEIGFRVLKACVRQLAVGRGAGQIRDHQSAQKDHKGENNDQSYTLLRNPLSRG